MSAMHFDAETGTRTDEAMPDDAIRYSRGRNKYDASPEQRVAADFDAFEQAFLADRSTAKGKTFVCAAFRINGDGRPHRGKDEALPRAFLPFDLDAIPDADTFNELRQWFTGYRGFGYTTASHRPEAPRCRIVLAADRAMSRDEGQRACLAIQRRVERDFGPGVLKFDENVYRAEQPLFTPLHGAMDFRFLGEPVNVDELLAEVPPEAESPSGKRNEPGAHADWLAALLEGDDVHGNACRLIGRWVALGWDDATIRATMDALAIGVAAARGRERAAELLGEELDRMIEGARRNGYDRARNGAGAAQTAAEDAEHQRGGADAEAADDALRPVGFRSFVQALEPPTYAVDGLLIRGYCYSFTGPSGHGKTAIAMNLAAVKSVGELFAGRETTAERVLYVAGENPDDVRMRALAQAGALRLSPDVLEDRLQFIDRSFALGDRHAELMKVIEAGGFGMVILDTDQALSSDADENSNAERIEHAKRVRMLTKTAPRPTVIDLCHPPVNAGRNALRPRGGSSFLAEIDGNAGVWMDDGDTRAELFRTPKFRGPMFEPLLFDIKVIELAGLADSKGRPMTTAIALPADEADTEADEAARRRRLSLLADISLHPGSTVRERATRTGSPTTTVYRDLRYLLSKGAINEAMDGHEITPRGKKWLAAS